MQALRVLDRLIPQALSLGLLPGRLAGLEGQLLETLLHPLAVALEVLVVGDLRLGVRRPPGLVLGVDIVNHLDLEIVVIRKVDVVGLHVLALEVFVHLFSHGHALSYPRGSSTTASTVSSLMIRNSLPATLNRVPE